MKNTSQILREDLLNTPSHQRGTGQGTENLQPPLPGLDKIVKPFRFAPSPYVYKVVPLREARTPDQMTLCDTPEAAAAYWRLHVPHAEAFDPECECFTVLLLNTRRRIKAHHLVSVGTHDTLLVHPLQVFRLAIMTSAAALVLTHNHPSGDASPSEADIKVTRDLIRAGQLLKIEMLDSIVIGHPAATQPFVSLRAAGYFYS
jgi:DNA repair protein RadC